MSTRPRNEVDDPYHEAISDKRLEHVDRRLTDVRRMIQLAVECCSAFGCAPIHDEAVYCPDYIENEMLHDRRYVSRIRRPPASATTHRQRESEHHGGGRKHPLVEPCPAVVLLSVHENPY